MNNHITHLTNIKEIVSPHIDFENDVKKINTNVKCLSPKEYYIL